MRPLYVRVRSSRAMPFGCLTEVGAARARLPWGDSNVGMIKGRKYENDFMLGFYIYPIDSGIAP